MHVDDEASAAGRAPADASSEGTPLPAAELVDEEEEEEEPPAAAVVEEPPAAAVEQQQQLARLSPSLSLLHVSFSSACVCVCVCDRSIGGGTRQRNTHTTHGDRPMSCVRSFGGRRPTRMCRRRSTTTSGRRSSRSRTPTTSSRTSTSPFRSRSASSSSCSKPERRRTTWSRGSRQIQDSPELMSEDTELDSAVTSAAVLLKEVWKHGPAVSVAIPYATGPTHFIMTQLGLLQKTDEYDGEQREATSVRVQRQKPPPRALQRAAPAAGVGVRGAHGAVVHRAEPRHRRRAEACLGSDGQYKAFRATRALLGDVQRKTWGSTTLAQLADVSPDRCGAFDKLYAQLRELGVDDPGALPVARLEEALPVAVGAGRRSRCEVS